MDILLNANTPAVSCFLREWPEDIPFTKVIIKVLGRGIPKWLLSSFLFSSDDQGWQRKYERMDISDRNVFDRSQSNRGQVSVLNNEK